jgi:hypothetical protein
MIRNWAILLSGVLCGCASLPGKNLAPTGVDKALIPKAPVGPVEPATAAISIMVRITGRVRGRTRDYYLPLQSPNQGRPAVGQVCTIHWRLMKGTWHDPPPMREIERFECAAP